MSVLLAPQAQHVATIHRIEPQWTLDDKEFTLTQIPMANVGDPVEGMIKFQVFSDTYDVEVAFTRAYFSSQGDFEYNLAVVPPSQDRISGVRIDSEIFQTTNDPSSPVDK